MWTESSHKNWSRYRKFDNIYFMNEKYPGLVYERESVTEIESEKTDKKGIKTALAMVFLFTALIVVAILSLYAGSDFDENKGLSSVNKVDKEKIARTIFGNIHLDAKAYAVMDMRSGTIIAGENLETQLPLASLTKIMTAVVAKENFAGNMDTIVVNDEDLVADGNNGLNAGERWNIDNLINFTLVVSSNDGAEVLASAIESLQRKEDSAEADRASFVDLMNQKASELGMKQTYFINPSGLDIDENTQSGSYGSVSDIIKLFAYAIINHPRLFEATSKKESIFFSEDMIGHSVKNTNQEVSSIPGLFASKTGLTDLAGGNLAIAFDAGLMQPYLVVVLGSSKDGRFSDVEKLYQGTKKYLESQNPR